MADLGTKQVVSRRERGGRHIHVERVVDDEGLARLRAPRSVSISEHAAGDDTYTLASGPVERYERRLAVAPGPDPGTWGVSEDIRYRLAIPIWGWMFEPLVRKAVVDPPPPGTTPWWATPDVLDARASRSLSLLCVFAAFAAYLGVLLSQTNTYFKEEFGSSNSEISFVLIGVRLGGVLALLILAFADRRGRRRVLLAATYAGILLAA
ncbi:MAG TPA: hypothetical protein PKA98_23165, partial [Acidimicrobiales bacterium]|nr:hypothetical protein [Acidimicrobiales bacterium]